MTTVRDLLKQRLIDLQNGQDEAARKRAGIIIGAAVAGYYWDSAIGRYREAVTGRLISERTLLSLGERYYGYAQGIIQDYTEQFLRGGIDIARWQELVALELKDAYNINMLIGRGGKAAAEWADYGRIGGRLHFEYRRLDLFAQEIKGGMLSDDYIRNRASMYADGVRSAYFDGLRAAKEAGEFVEERRVLNPADHCDDCVEYAARGWQPIGTLPPPGIDSECLHNCKCDMEFRTAKDASKEGEG